MRNGRCLSRSSPPRHRWRSALVPALALAAGAFSSIPARAEPKPLPASVNTSVAATEAADGSKVAPSEANSGSRRFTDPPRAQAPSLPALDARAGYRALIEKEVAGTGLAPDIAEAVMAVESGYNPAAIGGVGEIGLMQILPSTARMLGFSGSNADLAVPATNIRYGVAYLVGAWRLARGDLCTATMKYRAGHGESRFSHLSVNYCVAVRSKLFARGFPVVGSVPVATFGEPVAGGCGRKCLGVGRIGSVDLAALNIRLGALVTQVRATRR